MTGALEAPGSFLEASRKYFQKYQTLDFKFFLYDIHSNNLCPKTIELSVRVTFMAQGAGSCVTIGTAGHAERSGKFWEQFYKSPEAFRKFSGSKTVLEGPWPTRRPGASLSQVFNPPQRRTLAREAVQWIIQDAHLA